MKSSSLEFTFLLHAIPASVLSGHRYRYLGPWSLQWGANPPRNVMEDTFNIDLDANIKSAPHAAHALPISGQSPNENAIEGMNGDSSVHRTLESGSQFKSSLWSELMIGFVRIRRLLDHFWPNLEYSRYLLRRSPSCLLKTSSSKAQNPWTA